MAAGIHAASDFLDSTERWEMLKAFDETRTGVKGLLDPGLDKIPKIFVRPSEEVLEEQSYKISKIQFPVIDLSGIHDPNRRKHIVEQVRRASGTWGFFQVVNHGIPSKVLGGMIDGVQRFNEGDLEEKKKFYTRDHGRSVRFNSNYDLYSSKTASWRDTLIIKLTDQTDTKELPDSCRENIIEYSKHVVLLGNTLLELLSEALGLEPNRLNSMECSNGHRLGCHYYPACPQPELTIGTPKHADTGFLTILLQNHIGGLQVMHQNEWVNVEPTPEALVINIGDLLQLVTNGKFISSKHRVVANHVGPRISVALFLNGPVDEENKIYGPIKELVSEENPVAYKDVALRDYATRFLSVGLDKNVGLDYYKL